MPYKCPEKKKQYDKEYAKNNPPSKEKMRERNKKYYAKHKEKEKQRTIDFYYENTQMYSENNKKWIEDNKERRDVYLKEYRSKPENKAKRAACESKRQASQLQRTPPWLTEMDFKEIQEYYLLAKELSWLCEGETLEVDHIVPLQGKNVSGLHVPWNLQILTKSQNASKNNKF